VSSQAFLPGLQIVSAPCVLKWSSLGVCPDPFIDEDMSYITFPPTPMTSCNLNHLFKGSVSKYSHILRFWGLGFQHTNFGGTQFSPFSLLENFVHKETISLKVTTNLMNTQFILEGHKCFHIPHIPENWLVKARETIITEAVTTRIQSQMSLVHNLLALCSTPILPPTQEKK